jgi:hypothetical protein
MIVTTGEAVKKLAVLYFLCSANSNVVEGQNEYILPISTDKLNGFHLVQLDTIANPDLLTNKSYIYNATIPDDAIVLANSTYTDIYTNKINITNKRKIWEDAKICSIIFSNLECYKFFPNINESMQTYSMAMAAIKYCPAAFLGIRSSLVDEKMCNYVISKSSSMITHIDKKKLTHGMCKMAINNNPLLLKDIVPEFKTTELCVFAIESAKLMRNPCIEKVLSMINHDNETYAKCCNKTNSPMYYFECAFKNIDQKVQTEHFVKFAINNNPLLLKYVREDLKTEDLCRFACEKKWRAYKFIKEDLKSNFGFIKYRMLRHFEKKEILTKPRYTWL